MQRDEELVGGGHLGGLVDRGCLMALDLGDQVAGERTERAAQQEHDRDLAGRALVGGVDRLHRDRGHGRDDSGDRGADRGPAAPHVAGEQQPGDRGQHVGAGEAARDGADRDGQAQLEDHQQTGCGCSGSAASDGRSGSRRRRPARRSRGTK